MAHDPLRHLLRSIGRLGEKAGGTIGDAQLLDRFARSRDEAAFELLVWRHGPMVLGVCSRILRDAHDAEDAFQATFLTLARKADTLARGEALAAWLYRVASRIAWRARTQAARRAQRNRNPAVQPKESGGRGGLEPTRYGDWEKDGLASDF